MSLVRVFSDIHLEFGISTIKKCIELQMKNPSKYIILAGDITNFKKRDKIMTSLISELSPYVENTKNIIYVLGNHEYYEPDNNTTAEIETKFINLSKLLGITLLQDDFYVSDDFVFYGTTMWTNPSIEAYFSMNDRFSFKSRQDIINRHENSALLLNKFLYEYNNKKPLVVITHHLPSFSLIDPEYKILNLWTYS